MNKYTICFTSRYWLHLGCKNTKRKSLKTLTHYWFGFQSNTHFTFLESAVLPHFLLWHYSLKLVSIVMNLCVGHISPVVVSHCHEVDWTVALLVLDQVERVAHCICPKSCINVKLMGSVYYITSSQNKLCMILPYKMWLLA